MSTSSMPFIKTSWSSMRMGMRESRGSIADSVFPPAVGANTGGKNVVNTWQGRSCTNCHTQTHGSNNPAATNPTPNFLFR